MGVIKNGKILPEIFGSTTYWHFFPVPPDAGQKLVNQLLLFTKISGIFKKISVVLFIGLLAWAYQATRPPPSKLCGSPGGPPITAPRIKLKDGRYLAYKEHGVPKDKAKHKIVFVNGFNCMRFDEPIASALSPVFPSIS